MIEVPPPLNMIWFKFLLGLIVGLALGSFATMLSYRLPHRLSLIMPPSHCPRCKKTLAVTDLVPIFSYVASRGKCRYCGGPISLRYPMIELAMGISTALAFAALGYQPLLLLAVLGIVAVITTLTIKLET